MLVQQLISPTGDFEPTLVMYGLTDHTQMSRYSKVQRYGFSPSDPVIIYPITCLASLTDQHSDSHMAFNSEWNDTTLYLICKARLEVGCKDHCVWIASRNEGVIEGVIYVNPPGISWGESFVLLYLASMQS
jgi:hypothetical protein